MEHEAEFIATLEDNIALLRHATLARHPGGLRSTKRRAVGLLLLYGFGLAAGLWLAWESWGEPLDVSQAFPFLVLGFLASSLWNLLSLKLRVRPIAQAAIRESAIRMRTGPLRMVLDDDGVTMVAATARYWLHWREIAGVDVSADRVIISARVGTGLSIPRRAFADGPEGEQRFRALADFAAAHRAVAPPTAPAAVVG